ncbi:SET domain-containing protein [Gymnopus androsaceus JB14]|uniref:SET domain-containing protein n=1 Tax=Gymnopus androsaceus JB14 TaxID=1447944 RepID=A0A6A4GMX8_9AGAR|nr:SET domain-containing protein [Gymnopus androsaceus JB14]
MYSALPQSVEVRRSKLSGRGIWAKKPIRAGSVIIVAKPYASTLSSENLQSYCSSCFAPSGPDGMKRCTKCRTVYYCDSTCQNNDWKIHKHECTSLQNWFQAAPSSDTLPPSDAVRCMSRMLWKWQKNGLDSDQAKEIANMQSHRTNVKSSAYETYTHLAHALVQYMSLTNPSDLAEFGLSSAADLVDIISRFVTNTFTVTDPALTPLGAAVSPLVALINHSCDPNAVVVFPRTAGDPKSQEPLMQVVAIQDIYPEEDSYIDVTLPTSSRQQALEETYHFKCTCHLCTSKTDVDPREAMNCPKNCGGLCPLPSDEHSLVRCAKCKSVVKSVEATLDAVRVGQQGLDKATRLQMTDPAKSIQLTTNLIPILTSAGLSPSSHPLLGLTRLHQSLLTASFPDPLTQDHLDETIRTATKNITGLATLLREGHPVLALAVTELGKLLAAEPRADTLLRARNMLLVGFGTVNEGGQVGGEVREMIVALEKEIDVFKQGVRNVLEDRPKIKNLDAFQLLPGVGTCVIAS